ncbi:1-deoxy-D-xylulose 5-phosphate reductoisomerase [Paramagnetospirillum magnetotacticum MS-1]|uniref:1-deoxy-D-xylulose 5-phosphate reductoisomerase n=1 Tax=Paramagnetospirillum magnetotacticum MS-1 TaxID=272627 RepID=A0A0C2V1D8_PARME|nr:1-deoxy-D-xylulose-5-phosphate reductoisomerase [Paramagnetospirillum magnetotacticum]KIL98901.1 1-deoxy-D-xylulose 5-phosphate reductoisomerase [Paramagnetospirillum magnetotacticum MS-1]
MSGRKGVTILGSTGSIGCNTVDLVERNPELYRVEALVANSRVDILAQQAKTLRAKLAVVADEGAYGALKEALAGTGIEAAAGPEAVVAAARMPADWVMAAIVGAAGLAPTLAAVRRGAVVGLANKECLVCAGQLMMAEVEKHGATLLPVDSEHSAIFQVFEADQHDRIEKIILTASGGPFRTKTREFMADVTPEQAVAHPNWSMGAKISVDSASMFNKGLELIEAHHLFDMPEDKIDIVVHPQSVIHSLVAYVDGSVLAQLGSPDMRTPIAYALGWPNRIEAPVPRLDLATIATLTFEAPDPVRFPSLRLAREALRAGGSAAAVMNAANEVSVAAFLGRRIGFLDIASIVERTVAGVTHCELTSIDDVLAQDAEARRFASALIDGGR